jgi:transcriptional regulator with XRE-family HTH domain
MSKKIDPADRKLMGAVRELRLAVGDSQQDFAGRMNLSTISVARHERSRAPRGKVLAKLAEIANAHGFDQLEDIFRQALIDELGGPPPAGSPIAFNNAKEKDLALALLDVLRRPQYSKEADMIQRILEPIALERQEDADFFEASQRGRIAITRLLRKGYAVEAITNRMGESVEKIAEALFHSGDAALIQRRTREVVDQLLKSGWTIERVFQRFGHGLGGVIISRALEGTKGEE